MVESCTFDPEDGCKYYPKHVELKIERNKNTYKKYIRLEL
jgi:hypothetical protein